MSVQQRRDVPPRQFGEQLVLGRVAGLPFGHVDAFGFQVCDVSTAEMLGSIAVTEYGGTIAEGSKLPRIGFDFGSALAIEISGGEAPYWRVVFIESVGVVGPEQAYFRHPFASDNSIAEE